MQTCIVRLPGKYSFAKDYDRIPITGEYLLVRDCYQNLQTYFVRNVEWNEHGVAILVVDEIEPKTPEQQ